MTSPNKKDTRRKRALASIDTIGCTGCSVCVSVCPSNCITIIESDLNFTGIARVNKELCNGCFFCAIDCPWETIAMVNPDGSLAEYGKTAAKLRGYV
jgi:Pyruvate/2-oxoacid:ferredoxin oxidoreductase delta subunit